MPGIELSAPEGTLPLSSAVQAPPAGSSPRPSDDAARAGPAHTVRLSGDPPDDAEGRTVGVVQQKLGVDPVVGWLVCIEGPDRGRDYRIRNGRNSVGRADHMHICIHGDSAISREKHAVVSYDPRHQVFRIAPGDSTGMTYVNGDAVEIPVTLNARDVIEMGASRLLFVPLCGPDFEWTASDNAQQP